ncbi:hypothetical protein [Saccharothrix sp. Mg75]|uniref:hypothetical protein n=1 Tax=Saccharothrix sp. Mg75 TaxID=3445357 RepID=UPI003EE87D13
MEAPERLRASYRREPGLSWLAALPGPVAAQVERWSSTEDGPPGSGTAGLVPPVRPGPRPGAGGR